LLSWKVTVYCTDDWKPYRELLDEHPDAFHVITKSETVGIEPALRRLTQGTG
jgi:insertion element IS1 protein InsB